MGIWNKDRKWRSKVAMGIIKKIVKILSSIAYICILLYALVSIPIFLGYKPLVVLSGSMEPTYKVGSIIYYEENKEIEKGDIIVFEGEGGLVTHRVNEVLEGNRYETKGDANKDVDPQAVELQSIKGKALDITIPFLGYYVQYVNSNLWLIVVIIIILVSEFLLSNIKTSDIKSKEGEVRDGE